MARFLPDGPVHGIVMAAGIDDAGSPLQPASTFDTAAPKVTAIVSLGAVGDGAMLTVEWHRIGAAIDELNSLFAHQIAVEPFQRAYSVGVSEGVLAPGVYEVTASLGDHDVSALWRVADSGAAAAGGKEAQPPAAGESGAIDDASSSASAATGAESCRDLDVSARGFYLVVLEYKVFSVRNDCPTAVAAAAVEGPPVVLGEHKPTFGDYVNPCLLPGGSDMPGTVVRLSAWWAGNQAEMVREEEELVDPEEPPLVIFQSEPASGSRVKAGDTVTLEAGVIKLAPAKGLRWAELRSPDEVLAREEREVTPCDPRRFVIVLKATYTVPEDPPPVIELTAVAEDHDGLEATETITLVTEERWAGTMRSETKRTYLNPENAGQACTDVWEGELAFAVDEAGAVEGNGEATLTAGPACDFPHGHAFTVANKVLFTVEGDGDEAGFTLRLGVIRWVPATGASIAGFHNILATGAGTVDAKSPGPPFEVPKLDPCTAEGEFTLRSTVGVIPFDDPTVAETTMELRCSEP